MSILTSSILGMRVFPLAFILLPFFLLGQNQSLADSLIAALESEQLEDSLKLATYVEIAQNQNDPELKLFYSKALLGLTEDPFFHYHAFLQKGQAYRLMGDFEMALQDLYQALELSNSMTLSTATPGAYTALADVYSVVGNYANAIKYYKMAIGTLDVRDSSLLAIVYLNLGDTYYVKEAYDSSLQCFMKSKRIYEKLGDDASGIAYNLGNIGLVMAEMGQTTYAEENIWNAIKAFQELEDHYASTIFLNYMSDIYVKKGRLEEAIFFADSSLSIAEKYNFRTEIRDINSRLSAIHENMGEYESALNHHRSYVLASEEISSDEVIARISNLESTYELAQREAEVKLLKVQRKNQQVVILLIAILLIAALILGAVQYRNYRVKVVLNAKLEEQKEALERLNTTKDKFFSIISHDLRGPVSSFLGISDLIKYFANNNNKEELLKVAEDVEITANRLSGLLDSLLSWAMQQQGHFPNVPERVNLKVITNELLGTFHNMAKAKDISLNVEVPNGFYLWVDKNTTQTILRNLVNNALKFTDKGGYVNIKAGYEGEKAKIQVTDNGVGIGADQLSRLFKLQEHKSSFGTFGEKGLGLGLQLVYEFIEMNNGSIQVESQEGNGTTFTIILPLFETSLVDTTTH